MKVYKNGCWIAFKGFENWAKAVKLSREVDNEFSAETNWKLFFNFIPQFDFFRIYLQDYQIKTWNCSHAFIVKYCESFAINN